MLAAGPVPARAVEPVVDCVEVATRAPNNPRVKVWYRVPRRHDAARPGRWRVLVLFGGRNADGRPEVSGKLGWTEWADLNGVFLVAPSFSRGEYWVPSNGAADVLRRAVDALRRRHGVRPLPVFLFGYSAGGQLVALLQDDPPFPVAAWGVCGCGVFPDVPRAGAPALVACGVDDAGRLEIGRTFAYRYREAGGPLLWYPAKGGHEPNERALRLARAFLAAAASKTERVPASCGLRPC